MGDVEEEVSLQMTKVHGFKSPLMEDSDALDTVNEDDNIEVELTEDDQYD